MSEDKELREQVGALDALARRLFEQQFVRCGGRKEGDPSWDDLEQPERDEYWDRALDVAPLLAAKDAEIAEAWRRIAASQLDVLERGKEIARLRREVAFEACSGEITATARRRDNIRFPLCACLTAEQITRHSPRFSRPVCAVHPEGGQA